MGKEGGKRTEDREKSKEERGQRRKVIKSIILCMLHILHENKYDFA